MQAMKLSWIYWCILLKSVPVFFHFQDGVIFGSSDIEMIEEYICYSIGLSLK